MEKKFEELKNPKQVKINGSTYYTSTIPAFFAQRILLKAGDALSSLDVSKLPETVITDLLSYTAYENEYGNKIVLDCVDIINECVANPIDLIELELKEIEENYGFFFDGSLQSVFAPLMELIKAGVEKNHSGMSTP